MRIGIDARMYRISRAGIGRYTQNLIEHILKIDKKNKYLLFLKKEDFSQCKLENPNLVKIKTKSDHYSISEQIEFRKVLQDAKLDLMHFTNFNHPIFYKGRFITTIHDLTLMFFPGRRKKSPLYRLMYKFMVKRACQNSSKIIADTNNTKKDIIRCFNTKPSKIKVIYLAAEEIFFSKINPKLVIDLKKEYNITKPIILYIGQWRKHKNLVRLLEAFKFVKNKFNIDCQIVICGTKDPAYPEIIETIDRLKLFDDTIMPGFIDSAQLPLWYKMADVFVFPSFYEGFGLPPLEAMAVGTPVVASKSSCLPEVLGDAAVYFDYTSSKDLADKIASVLKKKSLRAELKRKGRKQAKKYSWEKTAQETLEIYQRSFK